MGYAGRECEATCACIKALLYFFRSLRVTSAYVCQPYTFLYELSSTPGIAKRTVLQPRRKPGYRSLLLNILPGACSYPTGSLTHALHSNLFSTCATFPRSAHHVPSSLSPAPLSPIIQSYRYCVQHPFSKFITRPMQHCMLCHSLFLVNMATRSSV